MIRAPHQNNPRPLIRTTVAHFEGPDGELPIGVRVVEPAHGTRQAQRGYLYAIVELLGDNPAREQFAERLLSAIQRTYYTRKGSQSQVLAAAVREAHQKVVEFNQQQADDPLRAGIICAALLGPRLIMIQNGSAVAFITNGDTVERYPSDLASLQTESLPDRPANWEIYRQELSENGAFFIGGGTWLGALPVRMIAGTVAHVTAENSQDATDGLMSATQGVELTGLMVVVERLTEGPAESGHRSTPASESTQAGDEAKQSEQTRSEHVQDGAKRRFPGFGGLPSSVHADPPVVSIPETAAETPSSPEPDVATPAHSMAHGSAPIDTADDTLAAAEAAAASDPGRTEKAVYNREDETFVAAVEPGNTADYDAGAAATWADDASGDEHQFEPELPSRYPTQPDERRAGGGIGAAVAGVAAAVTAGVGGLLSRSRAVAGDMLPAPERPVAMPADPEDAQSSRSRARWRRPEAPAKPAPFQPPQPARGRRARLFILLALLIAVLVPVVVMVIGGWRGSEQRANAAALIEESTTRYLNGQRSLDDADETTARQMFNEAQELLDAAIAIIGNTTETNDLGAKINLGLRDASQARYLYSLVDPLIRFAPEAEPRRVLVADESIFVLDSFRQVVERFQFDSTRTWILDQAGEVVLSEGMQVNGTSVARLVDMAWHPVNAGYQERATLVVFDRNNRFFRYDQRVSGISIDELSDPAVLHTPNQLEIYNGRTYVADEGTNQLLRFSESGVIATPDSWFAEQTRVNLTGLLTMLIDGDIWLLYNNGQILRYNGGEQVPFSTEGGVVVAEEPVDMAMGDLPSSYVYIADAAQERILVFDKFGAYQFQLLAPEGNPLRDLRGLFIDEIEGSLYILTKEALFQHPLVQ